MVNLLFVVLCAIWGSSFILMKRAARDFNPIQIGALRLLGGALTLALIVWVMRRPWPFHKRHILPLFFLAVVGYVIPFVVQPYVIGTERSALMGMMISLTPILIVAVSVPMLREYPTKQQLIGVIGGLIFAACLFADSLLKQPIRGIGFGELLLAASVPLSYAVAYTYIRRRFEHVSSLVLSCVSLVIGAAILLPAAAMTHSPPPVPDHPASPMTSMVALALLGILCTGIATFIFYWMIKLHGPLRAGVVSYVVPVVAIFWGWKDGEPISYGQIGSIIGVMAMVALVRWRADNVPPM
ncbi:MAG: DMT family transporter [Planctomycetes bacterium]|nr:DMT family transporter [Planctomycetota bacterium]